MEIRSPSRSSSIGMPTQSTGYNTPPTPIQESSAKLTSTPTPAERRLGGHSAVLSPNQTLDRQSLTHHHHHHHHHRHHQLNLHLYNDHDHDHNQQRVNNGSPDVDLATTPTTAASPSKRAPSPQPSPSSSQPTRRQTNIATESNSAVVRYRECLKNHAASMGRHVLDGCGEFMPTGEEGTPEALKCAACECHRNFHRKEIPGQSQQEAAGTSYYHGRGGASYGPHRDTPSRHQSHPIPHPSSVFGTTPSTGPLMVAFGSRQNGAAADSSSEDLNMFQADTGPHQAPLRRSSLRKRVRTKFSQQQKDKMLEFAQRIGWRIQKQDEHQANRFCEEVGVTRQVFKVWMHNNKQATKKNVRCLLLKHL